MSAEPSEGERFVALAAITAKKTHAPDMVLIYESGAVDALPPVPPLSTGSPSVVADTAMVTSCLDVFSMLQRGVTSPQNLPIASLRQEPGASWRACGGSGRWPPSGTRPSLRWGLEGAGG